MKNTTYATILAIALSIACASTPPVATAGRGDCGQPITTGTDPTATDALFTLQAAVGLQLCDLSQCDVDASCSLSATDALRLLQFAVGAAISLDCGCGIGTTTTSTTVTTIVTVTTTTITSTSTTLPAAATFTEVYEIFTAKSCGITGCHSSAVPEIPPGGNLGGFEDIGTAYTSLLGHTVTCLGSTFTSAVVPGDPDASFLMNKLTGVPPECGLSMPVGPLPLEPAEVEIIRSWILDGAQNN